MNMPFVCMQVHSFHLVSPSFAHWQCRPEAPMVSVSTFSCRFPNQITNIIHAKVGLDRIQKFMGVRAPRLDCTARAALYCTVIDLYFTVLQGLAESQHTSCCRSSVINRRNMSMS